MKSMNPPAIELHSLTKKFGDFTAVNGISLTIPEGEIFGLLGPNGAGKTTTLSMLATLSTPTSGHAEVVGKNTASEKEDVRRMIGMVFQDPSLDDDLSGRENLDFHGRLYKMPLAERNQRIVELVKLVDLEAKIDQQVKTFSGGMKRRLEIARALMHLPRVLFLDEPTLGLDPQTRRKLWEYIRQINKERKLTIILTTHYMDEADELCTRIGIVDKGTIIALDTPAKLKATLGGDVITLDTSNPDKMLEALAKDKTYKEVSQWNHSLNVVVEGGAKAIPKLLDVARARKIEVHSVSLKQPTLEEVFIHYTGRSIREQEADSADAARKMMAMRRGR